MSEHAEDVIDGVEVEDYVSPEEAAEADFADFYDQVSIHVEEQRCEQDFIRLPGLIATYGRRVASATRNLLTSKREYEYAAASLYGQHRRSLEDDPAVEGRLTEARIDAAVRSDLRWVSARAKYDDDLADKAEVQARFDALKSKETALQSLAATYRAEVKLSSH